MNGDYFKEVPKYHGFSDFSLCADRLTAKTAIWHKEALKNWGTENEEGKTADRSVSKAFGYELLARVGNVLLFPAALLDAIVHVAFGVFTLIAVIPEKIYLLKKSGSEQSAKGEVEKVEVNAAVRIFTFAGACSHFQLAINFVGVAIFGTIKGVLFDPQAVANRAKDGHIQIIADTNDELDELSDHPKDKLVKKSDLDQAQARIEELEEQILALRKPSTNSDVQDHMNILQSTENKDKAEVKEEKEKNPAEQPLSQTNTSPPVLFDNKTSDQTTNTTETFATEEASEKREDEQNVEGNEEKLTFDVDQSQFLELPRKVEDEKSEVKVAADLEQASVNLNENEKIESEKSSEDNK